jgi:hypothetical protein
VCIRGHAAGFLSRIARNFEDYLCNGSFMAFSVFTSFKTRPVRAARAGKTHGDVHHLLDSASTPIN